MAKEACILFMLSLVTDIKDTSSRPSEGVRKNKVP